MMLGIILVVVSMIYVGALISYHSILSSSTMTLIQYCYFFCGEWGNWEGIGDLYSGGNLCSGEQ